jgi:putative tricarboxylic transport membrane protein
MGPLAETKFKLALQISNGDYSVLYAGTLTKAIYFILFMVIVGPFIWNFKKKLAIKK